MEFLNELNDAQREAVLHVNGPNMIIAGAGSGKTRVLTYKIAYMISQGIDPFNILSLTFTNKAAREMKERVSSKIGSGNARNLWMGTFHSVFAKILRIEHSKIGYPANFTIYDSDDSKSLIKTILKEFSLDPKIYKPNLVYSRISSAKNNLISAEAYEKNTTIVGDDARSNKPFIYKIYQSYQNRCFAAGAMDFDDLLYKMNILLRDDAQALVKYQSKFKYILVDEFQDTNFSQLTILKRLAAKFENICVVGDDAQSIYAFRGANIENILNFKKMYTDTAVYKLEQNYRSTQYIVNAANSIIKHNSEQLKKEVWTSNVEGEKIKVFRTNSDNEEAAAIANELFSLEMRNHSGYDSYAILYRTNAQSRALEEALRRSNIPYRIYGGLSFYHRKEIKDLLAYYRLALNQKDEEAFKRAVNYPARGIGKTTIDKILLTAASNNMSLWEVVTNSNLRNIGIANATMNKLLGFIELIHSFKAIAENLTSFEAGEKIAASSGLLKELYSDKSVEGLNRYENIQELISGLKDFTENQKEQGLDNKLADFMNDVALLTDQDNESDDDIVKVTLMTIHASKGLEFPYVFVAGLEENLFPSQLSINSRSDLEEERRLFYVAITRAMNRAYLSFALTRFKWGNLNHCEPSRFIEEIDARYLDYPEMELFKSQPSIPKKTIPLKKPTAAFDPSTRLKKVSDSQKVSIHTDSDNSKLFVGAEVEHLRFGKGKITKLEGVSPNKKATVVFNNIGEKQLLLKFAKLKLL